MRAKETLIPSSVFFKPTSNSKRVRISPNKFNNPLLFTLLMSFLRLGRSEMTEAFNFVFDNNFYGLKFKNSGVGKVGELAMEAFTNITETIKQGYCGDVTETDLVPVSSDTIWTVRDFCASVMTFTKSTSSVGNEVFQDCLVNKIITPEIMPLKDQCDTIRSKDDITTGIVLGSIFGGLFLLIVIVCLGCVLASKCEKKKNVYSPSPESKNDDKKITEYRAQINSDEIYSGGKDEHDTLNSSFTRSYGT